MQATDPIIVTRKTGARTFHLPHSEDKAVPRCRMRKQWDDWKQKQYQNRPLSASLCQYCAGAFNGGNQNRGQAIRAELINAQEE